MDTLKFICGEWRLDQELERMEKYEAIAVKEMFKEFYQWMVDSNLSYNWEQEDEKVLLLYIINYKKKN